MQDSGKPSTVSAVLACHPSSRCEAVVAFTAQLESREPGRLTARFLIEGAIDRLLIPAAATPRRSDGLWRHTCFEVFIKSVGAPVYHEFNFSPSGAWATYRFERYRSGMTEPALGDEPSIQTLIAADRLEVEAHWRLPFDAALQTVQQRLALSAVIEERSAQISYWAVAHAVHRPDFHHPDGFVLRLPQR